MKPHQLLGISYRIGADPVKHNAADCLSLTRTVLSSYGIKSPEPTRDWYRRFRRKDQAIFKEELRKWGMLVTTAKIGVVALCLGKDSYALAVYWEGGWISFVDQEAKWTPLEGLEVQELYYPMKQNFVTP